MDLVSVVIPTFNRSASVVRAINSVLKQSYKHFELIVVDDGSTDETELILLPFVENSSIKYLKQQNLGVSAARNFGVSHGTGKWITFLDSDDEWTPHKLQIQIDYMQINPTLSIAYTQEIWIRNNVRVNQRAIHQKHGGRIFDKCIQQCFIAPSSVILKREMFLEMEGFDLDFEVCEDYDLWLRISSLYEIGLIPEPLIIKYGGHADQLSTQFHGMDLWRLRSLSRILKIRNLDEVDRKNVIETIQKKGLILIEGSKKHGNTKVLEEVESILALLIQ
jgi:glycosyltransferase involved in cell wall biosynthesis